MFRSFMPDTPNGESDLIKAGVRLFEMKRAFAPSNPPHGQSHGSGGSYNASLHAKTFAIDRSRVFIGSFNFDPRSARLNTEMGFIIDSPALAAEIADALHDQCPLRSYHVQLSETGSLHWIEQAGGSQIRSTGRAWSNSLATPTTECSR